MGLSDLTSPDSAVPLISFVICGRNDNYMGNYTWRITTAMNCLVKNLVRLGRQGDAEIILVDWNSPVPFHKEMELVAEAAGVMRFLVVPPEIAVPAQKDSRFPNPIAQNAGVRRARGRFIAVSDADVVLTSGFLLVLFAILEGRVSIGSAIDRTFMIASRAQVPTTRTRHNPPLAEIESYIDRHGALLKRDRMHEGLGAPAGLVLMTRELWFETRGYDERLIHHGWGDIELHLRMSQHYPWIDLANFGPPAVHLEHYAGSRATAQPQRKYNGYPVSRKFAANDEDWGMGKAGLVMHGPERVLDAAAEGRIAAAAVAARCAPISSATLAKELQLPEIRQLLETIRLNCPHDPAEADLMRFLAWYGYQRRPRGYLGLGAEKSSACLAVLGACTSCQAFLVDQWSEDDSGGERPIYHVSNLALAAEPQAQGHFITGDMTTALQRLFEEIAPPGSHQPIDLATIRTDARLGDPVRNAALIAEHLAPGGGVALYGRSTEEFKPVWEVLAQKFPGRIQLLAKDAKDEVHTGFLLDVPFTG